MVIPPEYSVLTYLMSGKIHAIFRCFLVTRYNKYKILSYFIVLYQSPIFFILFEYTRNISCKAPTFSYDQQHSFMSTVRIKIPPLNNFYQDSCIQNIVSWMLHWFTTLHEHTSSHEEQYRLARFTLVVS